MKIILSSAVLASVFSPAFSFSYLESLGGGGSPVALSAPPAAPAPVAPVAPAPVAPAAPVAVAPVVTGDAPAIGDYMDSLFSAGSATSGPGLHSMSHTGNLPSNTAVGGAGIQSHTGNIPAVNIVAGGSGLLSHTDNLGGGAADSGRSPLNFNPFSSKAPKSSSASASSGEFEISFPASSLQGLSQGGTVTLSGSIDSVSFN